MLWKVAKEAATNWASHNDARQGAALAYYSVFSLGPLIVIAIAIAGFVFGRDAASGQVTSSIAGMLGETGAKAVQAMLAEASRPREGLLATILGVGLLIFAAIGVVVQLKDALNIVWEVKDQSTGGLWSFIRSYVISLAAVLALGFLLLVSLLITTVLAAAGKYVAPYLHEWIFHLISLLVSFVVITTLFAMMFKWLPDVRVAWRDVWLGAVLTALLFRNRQVGNRILHWQAGFGINVWRRCIHNCRAYLGLLFFANYSDGSRIHPRLRIAPIRKERQGKCLMVAMWAAAAPILEHSFGLDVVSGGPH